VALANREVCFDADLPACTRTGLSSGTSLCSLLLLAAELVANLIAELITGKVVAMNGIVMRDVIAELTGFVAHVVANIIAHVVANIITHVVANIIAHVVAYVVADVIAVLVANVITELAIDEYSFNVIAKVS
jgi:hypothetical protein